jgi:hypothetical protein
MVLADLQKKWWKFKLHFVLNVCLVNSFILYDLTKPPSSTAHGNRQLTFRPYLVVQMIGAFTSRKRTGRKRSLPIGTASPQIFHTLQKISGRKKVCALCIEKKKRAPLGRGKETTINVSSVTFHCAVLVVFGILRIAKYGGAKLGE